MSYVLIFVMTAGGEGLAALELKAQFAAAPQFSTQK
jgi:hypothetical protein